MRAIHISNCLVGVFILFLHSCAAELVGNGVFGNKGLYIICLVALMVLILFFIRAKKFVLGYISLKRHVLMNR